MHPQFTESVRDALERAFHTAQENQHAEVNENHLLFSFLQGDIKEQTTVTLTKNGKPPIHFKVEN